MRRDPRYALRMIKQAKLGLLTVRIPDELRAALDEAAREDQRATGALVRLVLRVYHGRDVAREVAA